jgi:hypothetical protein
VTKGTEQWKPTPAAAEALGLSADTLYRMKKAGLLREGRQWVRANPLRKGSVLLWNVARVEVALGRA